MCIFSPFTMAAKESNNKNGEFLPAVPTRAQKYFLRFHMYLGIYNRSSEGPEQLQKMFFIRIR